MFTDVSRDGGEEVDVDMWFGSSLVESTPVEDTSKRARDIRYRIFDLR
jgi:hypothetical protein